MCAMGNNGYVNWEQFLVSAFMEALELEVL